MNPLIVKGAPLNVPLTEKGFGEYLFEQAEKNGDTIFQIDGESGKTETYSITKQRSTRVAIYLQEINIRPKDVVMLCCQNTIDNIIPALAASYIGAYFASIDPKQIVPDVRHAITLVEPKVIFVEEKSVSLVEKSLEETVLKPKLVVIGNSDKYVKMVDLEKENIKEESFQPIKQKSSDIAAILFSSGTTSAPKGIYLSNNYILNGGIGTVQHNHSQPDVLLHFSSLYWVSALILTGMVIRNGKSKVVASNIHAEKFLQLVEKYRITYVFTSNTYSYEISNLPEEILKKYDTSSLNCLCLGGSTMDPQQIIRLRKLLPHTKVVLGYGATEANYMVCHDVTNTKAYEEKISSSGTALPGTEYKFLDLETGKLLGPNQEGEIRCKSPFLMSGYHNFKNPDCFDEDGFLKVGDIGYYDEDKYIYITDRLSEMFKYKTNQISPSLLEHKLVNHPAVAEAVVFGVPHPVDRNHAAACVVLKKGFETTTDELLEFINTQVSDSYKLRAGIMVVDVIPKTPTGKLQRRIVRDCFIKTNKKQ